MKVLGIALLVALSLGVAGGVIAYVIHRAHRHAAYEAALHMRSEYLRVSISEDVLYRQINQLAVKVDSAATASHKRHDLIPVWIA